MDEEKNVFINELKKFVGKQVKIYYMNGTMMDCYEGILRAISYSHLSCILMTGSHKILFKHIQKIERVRSTPVNTNGNRG